jgi:hypothetical protein
VKRGCDAAELGSRVIRTDTEWYKSGARKHLVRQAYDENGNALSQIPNGNAARFEEDFTENAENDRPERIYETGFDQQLVGFSTREAKFSNGSRKASPTKNDGSPSCIEVYIKFVVPEQPGSRIARGRSVAPPMAKW